MVLIGKSSKQCKPVTKRTSLADWVGSKHGGFSSAILVCQRVNHEQIIDPVEWLVPDGLVRT